MKKRLTLIGILCLLLAFVLPIFVGPMSIMETPFWDSTPHTQSNPILGGDPGENPVRILHWKPVQSFIVDGTYELNRVEVYAQMCNYLPDELASLPGFLGVTLTATLYNVTPEGISTGTPLAIFDYDVDSPLTDPQYTSLRIRGEPSEVVSPDPTITYSLLFNFYGPGKDYYDICLFRSQSDELDGRGHIFGSGEWNPMPGGEGQDIAMRLYGTQVTNGNGNGITEPDCDGDGISDVNDTDDDNDCEGTTTNIFDKKETVPLLTAFLFALGGTLVLAGLGTVPLSGRGILFALILFAVLFALWYFWLFYAWTGIWA